MSLDHENEEILKPYDSHIMRRLLGYVKPYRVLFALSIVALTIATVGELMLPIMIQRATDGYILPYYRGIDSGKLDADQKILFGRFDDVSEIRGVLYIPASQLANISVPEKTQMRDTGSLLTENFFVFSEGLLSDGFERIVAEHPELFQIDTTGAAISQLNLRTLSREEIRIIRGYHYRGIRQLVTALLIILITVFVFTFLQVYLDAYVGQMVMKDIRTQLYDHALRFSLRFLDKNPVGKLVSRITNDVETINEMFTSVLITILKDFCVMIGVMVALFLLSPRLGIVTLITLPPVFVISVLFRKRARNAFRKVRQAISQINAFLSEHISGMRIIQLFVQEKRVHEDFEEKNTELLEANMTEMRLFAVFRPLVDFLATLSVAVIIYFGGAFFLRDRVSLGVLIAFLNLIRMFYRPVMDLSERYNILQSAMAGAERVFDLLDTDDRIPEPEQSHPLAKIKGKIEFDNVDFWYKEGEPVLRNLSFTVNPGETVAIVGYTGAGKTTITSVLTRLWDIQSGVIRIDDVDAKTIPSDQLRHKVQSVLQDVFLFSGTIMDNIRLGSDIPEEEVRKVVKLVKADGFIDRLPKGLETQLTERAGNLSTGQRQLLSFARVLAHNPDVLILDEATGNIDTETEKLIQSALSKLLTGRTSIVIAHRLSTIKNADRILVLHKGRLAEQGTHEELIKKSGMYHSLYQMQFLNPKGI